MKRVCLQGVGRFFRDEFSGWSGLETAWLVFCLLSVSALSLWTGDSVYAFIAAVTGISYTVFAGKGKISCFAFGMVNAPLYAVIAYRHGYFGDMALNVYYSAMMFPGAVSWWRHRNKDSSRGIVRTRLQPREIFAWAALGSFATAVSWWILVSCGGSRPFCDSLTNVLSIIAMVFTVKRCVEQWLMWIIVDLVEVFMWFKVWQSSGNSVSLLIMWILFLVNGIFLWRVWVKDGVETSLKRGSE